MTWSGRGAVLGAFLLGAACGGGRTETRPAPPAETSPLAAAVASATPVRDAGLPADEADAWVPPADAGSTGIAECDRYLAAIEGMVACEALPEEQRDSMREMGREQRQLLEVLGDPKIREERRRSAADACRRGADSLDQALARSGCGAKPAPMP